MNQKYLVAKDDTNTNIVITELVELTSNEFSLLSEQKYKLTDISKAAKAGGESLIRAIRSPNFFPPFVTAEKLAVAIEELVRDKEKKSVEVVVDDVRVMNELDVEVDELDEDEDIEDLDDILTDDDELPDEDEEDE
jgi:hypothetical protein